LHLKEKVKEQPYLRGLKKTGSHFRNCLINVDPQGFKPRTF
jgi:hypothetical protein